MAIDHPDRVTGLAMLDIVPTYYLYTHVTLEFVQVYFHWFNYLRAAPGPENQLKEDIERQAATMTTDVQLEYLRLRAMSPISTPCAKTIARARRSISTTIRPIWTRRSRARC
jgi:hypothetical protein